MGKEMKQSKRRTIKRIISSTTGGVFLLLFVCASYLFFAGWNEYSSDLMFGQPVYAEGTQTTGIYGTKTDYTKIFNNVYGVSEQDRIVFYLKQERNSILDATNEDKTKGFNSVLDICKSIINAFKGLFDPDGSAEASNDKVDATWGGKLSPSIRIPRMEFKNHDYDFESGKMSKVFNKLILGNNVKEKLGKNTLKDALGKSEKHLEKNLIPYIKKEPAKDKNANMMDITDKKITKYIKTDPITDEEYAVFEIEDYPMKDALFRMLEAYSLDWKLLYSIDRAILSDQNDDLKDMEGNALTEEQKLELKRKIMDRFFRVDIPNFMPQFDVVRHLKRDYSYHYEHSVSCPPSNVENGKCSSDQSSSTSDVITPVYFLEWIDILTKEQTMPTFEKLSYRYTEVVTDIDRDDGSSYYECTVDITAVYAPEYYKKTMGNSEIIRGDTQKEVTVREIKDGTVTTTTIDFDKMVSGPAKTPERTTKRTELKRIFTEEYKLKPYDIEFALKMSEDNAHLITGRYMLGWLYGIPVEFDLRSFKGIGYSAGLGDTSGYASSASAGSVEKHPELDDIITKVCSELSFDPNLCRAIIQQETGFANSCPGTGHGEGYMQLDYSGNSFEESFGITVAQAADPETNIRKGIGVYLSKLNAVDNNYELAVTAYNTGQGNVQKLMNVAGMPWSQRSTTRFSQLEPYIDKLGFDSLSTRVIHEYTPNVWSYYNQFCTLYGDSSTLGSGFSTSTGIGGGSVFGKITKLPKEMFDISKDAEKDAEYEGGPDSWGEGFRNLVMGAGGGYSSTATGPVSAGGYMNPVGAQYPITSEFGWRVLQGKDDNHTGIDFGVPTGEPIYAAKAGTVTLAGSNGGYGNCVIIDHGNREATLYAHMSQILATKGATVGQGQQIGLVGSTGRSTGPHLHFEIRVDGTCIDPKPYLP